jgi:hypothetical protein
MNTETLTLQTGSSFRTNWPGICSDSRVALLALSSQTVSSRLVLQCGNSLQELSYHNGVQLFWVPGHCGIIENEEADGLARVGSKSCFCGPKPCLPVLKSLMTRVTKECLSGNHLCLPCLKLARFLRNLPRTKLGVLIGLLTEHVRLNKHLHRMGLLSDPTCAACGIQEESALHFICVCPTQANLRTQIFGKPILSVGDTNTNREFEKIKKLILL